jgi:hypothetical protein
MRYIDETEISINEDIYGFKVNETGEITYIPPRKEKIFSYPKSPTENDIVEIPKIWLITRKNKIPLFALRPNEAIDKQKFRIIAAQNLYDQDKVQWFEPLADNYRELIWIHPNTYTAGSLQYDGYKHFSWNNIIDFSLIDRPSIAYSKNFWGDWKKQKEGGGEYLLVIIDKKPYWTDAIGKIPFAVDTTRLYLEQYSGNKDKAIIETIKTGIKHGDGRFLFPKPDNDNSYDNYMILRSALWTTENLEYYERELPMPDGSSRFTKTTIYKKSSDMKLIEPITENLRNKYGLWEWS